MTLQQRVVLLEKLGDFLRGDDEKWNKVKAHAAYENAWFLPEFIDYQLRQIADKYLAAAPLENWISTYNIPAVQPHPKNLGIVMAGNIPLAGFHDFLTVFLSGHRQVIKPSAKDTLLITAIISQLKEWEPATGDLISIAPHLKGCDAYIATGSNNSSRYFDYYFGRYPNIIRKNRTSIAVLTGNETLADLEMLADDVYLYFGFGCRNVTKLLVPEGFDFLPLLESFKKYDSLADHSKYKNNYDYQLAVLQINKKYYMTNGSIILQEHPDIYSPISQLHYEFHSDPLEAGRSLLNDPGIQCVVGKEFVPFGKAQQPAADEYADQADTLKFLLAL